MLPSRETVGEKEIVTAASALESEPYEYAGGRAAGSSSTEETNITSRIRVKSRKVGGRSP